MDILYLGHSSFHLKGKDSSVVTDPFDPAMVGIRFPRISATVVTISHDHKDHNMAELVSEARKVISGPGEYEIEGISIVGLSSYHDDKKGAERGKNTVYVYEMEGLRLCHLGDLGHKLSDELVEAIGDIDVLMIPVGGYFTLDGKAASEVTRAVAPKIAIPMHYNMPGLNKDVFAELSDQSAYVSELGLPTRTEKKLSLKAGMLPEDSQEIVVLEIS